MQLLGDGEGEGGGEGGGGLCGAASRRYAEGVRLLGEGQLPASLSCFKDACRLQACGLEAM